MCTNALRVPDILIEIAACSQLLSEPHVCAPPAEGGIHVAILSKKFLTPRVTVVLSTLLALTVSDYSSPYAMSKLRSIFHKDQQRRTVQTQASSPPVHRHPPAAGPLAPSTSTPAKAFKNTILIAAEIATNTPLPWVKMVTESVIHITQCFKVIFYLVIKYRVE